MLFVFTESANMTDTHTDTAWWHRPHLHSIARQKSWNRISGHIVETASRR